MTGSLLAYRPFLDPLDLHGVWPLLLLPLALLISIAYKAVRVPGDEDGRFNVGRYLRQTVAMTVQVVLAIAGLYVAAVVFVRFILPAIT